jgi:hypothetical protein
VTARYDAFMAALSELCIAHGVRLDEIDDYDYPSSPRLRDATADEPAGAFLSVDDSIEPTDADKAAQAVEDERQAALREQYNREWQQRRAEQEAALAVALADPNGEYAGLMRLVEAQAEAAKESYMRVSTDPTDKGYTTTPYNVWCNDRPIDDWVSADDFRRCVITKDGKVHNGSVRIEAVGAAQPAAPAVNTGFSGVFEAEPKAAPPQPYAVTPQQQVTPTVKPAFKHKRK